MSSRSSDIRWMRRALELAALAGQRGEVPVGAVVIDETGAEIGAGYNRPIASRDPSAHAEMVALRAAAIARDNYRLPATTLYVTMEPCPMCFGALVQARVATVVYGASDTRWGALGSVVNLTEAAPLNHRLALRGGVLADEAAAMLRAFFKARR